MKIKTNASRFRDFRKKLFRSSSPETVAVEICALAKMLTISMFSSEISYQVKQLFNGETCNHFMPDIFDTLCNCPGSCAGTDWNPDNSTESAPDNLLMYIFTDQGMRGCQSACRETEGCEYYTLSRKRYINNYYVPLEAVSGEFRCFLWTSCEEFIIPEGSTFYASEHPKVKPENSDSTYDRFTWSNHFSGPKVCSKWDQACPTVVDDTGSDTFYDYEVTIAEWQVNTVWSGFPYTCFAGNISLVPEGKKKNKKKDRK